MLLLLPFHWLKQVTWPYLSSLEHEIAFSPVHDYKTDKADDKTIFVNNLKDYHTTL